MMKEFMLLYYKDILDEIQVSQTYCRTIVRIVPKDDEIIQSSNRSPITTSPILYKVFPGMLYNRIVPGVIVHQCIDQYMFTPYVSVEDLL